jgi:hypothetical protein
MLPPPQERISRQEISILVALGSLNALVFACICTLLLFGGRGADNRQALQPSITRTSTGTFTPAQTSTPEQTNTLVLRPPPTSPPRSITPRSLAGGWYFYDGSPDGFAVALPPSWQRVNLDQASLDSYLQTLKDKNPKLATAFQAMSSQLSGSPVKFFAVDSSAQAVASNYVTTMNVVRESLSTDVPLDTYAQTNLNVLSRSGLPNKPPAHRRVQFTAGAAEEVKYQITVTSAGDVKITVSLLQYLLVHSKSGYVVTFGNTPDKDKAYAPVYQKVMQSLQWAP